MNRSKLIFFLLILALMSACVLGGPAAPAAEAQVITHPDGPLYVGDKVSFEVLDTHSGGQLSGPVGVSLDGKSLGSARLAPFGIGGREEATMWWVWDTSGLKPGKYSLEFMNSSSQIKWDQTVTLHPATDVPPPEPEAHWAVTTTTCCVLHYITGTAAARDIVTLGQEADEQSADVAAKMDFTLKTKIDVTLMPRVIGQGGFTTNSVYVSYLDDNYMGNEMPILFHHEFVHFYDGQIGGGYRTPMIEEGLAVYLTGGHFKPEPLGPRAAALLDLGWYIPLTKVADDFYNQQHDIGYLEAATVVKYLVDTYGVEAFDQFYRNIPTPHNQKDSEVLNQALEEHFHISFQEMESAYLAWLKGQKFTADERTDLRLTVGLFDTIRRYQKTLDPSAYFLTAWLPDGAEMRNRDIVADFLRRPLKPDNRLVEFLLIQAQKQLFSGQYRATDLSLKLTNWVLDLLGS